MQQLYILVFLSFICCIGDLQAIKDNQKQQQLKSDTSELVVAFTFTSTSTLIGFLYEIRNCTAFYMQSLCTKDTAQVNFLHTSSLTLEKISVIQILSTRWNPLLVTSIDM